jgi:hypothetical protein
MPSVPLIATARARGSKKIRFSGKTRITFPVFSCTGILILRDVRGRVKEVSRAVLIIPSSSLSFLFHTSSPSSLLRSPPFLLSCLLFLFSFLPPSSFLTPPGYAEKPLPYCPGLLKYCTFDNWPSLLVPHYLEWFEGTLGGCGISKYGIVTEGLFGFHKKFGATPYSGFLTLFKIFGDPHECTVFGLTQQRQKFKFQSPLFFGIFPNFFLDSFIDNVVRTFSQVNGLIGFANADVTDDVSGRQDRSEARVRDRQGPGMRRDRGQEPRDEERGTRDEGQGTRDKDQVEGTSKGEEG